METKYRNMTNDELVRCAELGNLEDWRVLAIELGGRVEAAEDEVVRLEDEVRCLEDAV
jgi:hypothetical protein